MRVLWITAAVVLMDQCSKFVVVRAMHLGQSIPLIGDWLKLTYTQNPGMAFGIMVGPRGMVTVLSLIATALITVYLYRLRGSYAPYRASLALILGGAIGNIIDRLFYGVLYDHGALFTGHVVDFIHVDLWRGYVQELFPFIGGAPKPIALFPIWNVADMAIVGGVIGILFFQKAFHEQMEAANAPSADAEARLDDKRTPANPDAPVSYAGPPVRGDEGTGEK